MNRKLENGARSARKFAKHGIAADDRAGHGDDQIDAQKTINEGKRPLILRLDHPLTGL